MPKRGLPQTIRMRHDEHYVDALTSSAGSPIGRMIPIDQIDPNPNQPRQVMGDLSELMASIAEKGIIEPIIVRQRGSRFQIVAGERRYQAAIQIGLRDIPIVIREVDDNEIIEVALVENLQRKDLTAFEESEALHSLADRCRYTHEDMAKRLGKSRTAITESLSLNAMPDEVKNLCRLADIHSKSLLLQIVRQGDPQKMVALVEKISREGGATREAGPQRNRQTQSRTAQGLRLQLPGAYQSLQAAITLRQGQSRPRRSNPRASGHHRRTSQSLNSGFRRFRGFPRFRRFSAFRTRPRGCRCGIGRSGVRAGSEQGQSTDQSRTRAGSRAGSEQSLTPPERNLRNPGNLRNPKSSRPFS